MIKKALEEWRRQKERDRIEVSPKNANTITPPRNDTFSNEEVVKLKQMLKNKVQGHSLERIIPTDRIL